MVGQVRSEHGVEWSQALVDGVRDLARQFFALSEVEKRRIQLSAGSGYRRVPTCEQSEIETWSSTDLCRRSVVKTRHDGDGSWRNY